MLVLWLLNISFNDNGLLGNIIWHSMLALNKDNNVLICNIQQEHFVNLYVNIFGDLKYLSLFCIDWSYIWCQLSDSPFTILGRYHKRETPYIFPKVTLEIMILYLCWVIYVIQNNTQHSMLSHILKRTMFLHKMIDNYFRQPC